MATYRSDGERAVLVSMSNLTAHQVQALQARGAMPERGQPEAPQSGPGTELKLLLASLGLTASKGCGCDDLAAQMDRWGPEGCRQNTDVILEQLRARQKELGWLEWFKTAAHAALQGLAGKVDWSDPAPGLLAEAIRRAEAKGPSGRGGQPGDPGTASTPDRPS